MSGNIISKKKPGYPVSEGLSRYLKSYSRMVRLPVRYDELLSYYMATSLYDHQGNDTLWETVFYHPSRVEEIKQGLTRIYAILKADGDVTVMKHLSVDRVDFCPFGNSNPFRIRIINNYNDNYDYFYVKTADASRIYGLELEHILSPNRINYLVYGNTLIEEHIVGIPGDQFIARHLQHEGINEIRLAKEFVKFNERCFVRLLGDMRSYNYVIDMTPDFDRMQYRIRAIDFDQQSYEGRKNIYLPQFFKENYPLVEFCLRHLNPETTHQYQSEERALIANRIRSSRYRLKDLMDNMVKDPLSSEEKTFQLRQELADHYQDKGFLKAKTMGGLVKRSLWNLMRKNWKRWN